jgi:hypothetical protein
MSQDSLEKMREEPHFVLIGHISMIYADVELAEDGMNDLLSRELQH